MTKPIKLPPRVSERLLAAVVDMQHYVTHNTDPDACAACPRWDELQQAAVAAADALLAIEQATADLRAELTREGSLREQVADDLARVIQRAEKAEAERDEARAELARLTTLRAMNDEERKSGVGVYWNQNLEGQWKPTHPNYATRWTPLPDVKEAP